MIFGIDSTALTMLINPDSDPPLDPSTSLPLTHARDRVSHLIDGLTATDILIVPAPVIAEILVQAGDGAPGVLAQIHANARIRIEPFGQGAAIELASMTRDALRGGDKRLGFDPDTAWQQVKFDRQIIAVCRFAGATRIYADDRKLVNFARSLGMDVISSWELPLPERTPSLFDDFEPTPRPRAIKLDDD